MGLKKEPCGTPQAMWAEDKDQLPVSKSPSNKAEHKEEVALR